MRRLAALTGEDRNRFMRGGVVDQFQHIAMSRRRRETRERDQKHGKGENEAFHIPINPNCGGGLRKSCTRRARKSR